LALQSSEQRSSGPNPERGPRGRGHRIGKSQRRQRSGQRRWSLGSDRPGPTLLAWCRALQCPAARPHPAASLLAPGRTLPLSDATLTRCGRWTGYRTHCAHDHPARAPRFDWRPSRNAALIRARCGDVAHALWRRRCTRGARGFDAGVSSGPRGGHDGFMEHARSSVHRTAPVRASARRPRCTSLGAATTSWSTIAATRDACRARWEHGRCEVLEPWRVER